jgi:hypothetical protein
MTLNQNDIRKNNIELLKRYHNDVWQLINTTRQEPVGKICLSQNGQPNLKVVKNGKDFFIHPDDNPQSEIKQFLNMVPESSTGLVCTVGMGLGYSALALIKNRPKIQTFLFFEPDIGIFIQALENIDLRPLLSDSRAKLIIGPSFDLESISKQFSKTLQLENIHIVKQLNLSSYKQKEYEGLYNQIFDVMLSYNMEGATLIDHGEKFLKNRFEHLRTIHHHRRLEDLQNAYSGTPSILVAAGPSLNKNIHLLSKVQGKAVIISVDSALPTLLAKGIHPDFVTSIDYSKFTYEKIADSAPESKQTSLICMPWVDISVAKKFPADNIFWTFSSTPIEKWMNACCGGSLSVGGVGTVAHLNLIASIVMGCSPHILIGQDLSYSGESDHAENVVLCNNEAMKQAIKKDNSPKIKSIDGGLLPTNKQFIAYKNMFEKIMTSNPGYYINSTAKGAHIEGTDIMPLEEAIDKYCTNGQQIFESKNHEQQKPSIDSSLINEELDYLHNEVHQLLPVFKKNSKQLKDVLRDVIRLGKKKDKIKCFTELPPNLQKKISKIDTYNKQIDSVQIIWSILETLTMEELRTSERMLGQIKRIENDPSRYLEYLEKNLIRLNDINTVRNTCTLTLKTHLETILNFHKKEKELLEKFIETKSSPTIQYQLAELYFKHGDYTLAKPIFDQIKIKNQAADVFYYLGCIAGYQTDFSLMEGYFKKALSKNLSIQNQIDEFREKITRQYIDYSEHFFNKNKRNYLQFLIKGARYNSEHAEIKRSIQNYFEEDLIKIVDMLQNDNTAIADELALDWKKEIEKNPVVEKLLHKTQLKQFYAAYGRVSLLSGNLQEALLLFEKAAQYEPDDPELLVLIADTYFTGNELAQGSVYLEKAVSIDNKFSRYWEILGDSLFNSRDYANGIRAYERCFIASPDRIELLKKIGDCYLEDGQMEAAKEAYLQFKTALEKNHV